MLVERAEYRVDHVLVRARAAFHMDVRLLVRRAPLLQQALKRSLGVGVSKLRPCVSPRRSLGEDVQRRVQPDRDGSLIEKLASARIDIGPAARSDHPDAALVDEPRNEPPLAVAEIVLAIAFENLSGRKAGGVLDGGVAVDERQAEAPRKASPDRRLSNSHQPHQHERPVEALPEFYHARGYTAAHPLGKSARMSRILVFIILLVVILGALYYLSTVPKEQPTHTIEVAVPQGATTGGNAH